MKIAAVLFLFSVLLGCGEAVYQPQAMLDAELECPEGSQVYIDRWGPFGENGWLKACSMKQGPFTAWNGEVKALSGSYKNGKKQGLWEFWDREGNKTKEIEYDEGVEVIVREF